MCKVMEELRVESFTEGREEGRLEQAKATALKMSQKGMSAEDIADFVGFDTETVTEWLAPKAC